MAGDACIHNITSTCEECREMREPPRTNLDNILARLDAERRQVIDDRARQLIEQKYQRQIDELVEQRALLFLKLQTAWVTWQDTPTDFKAKLLDQYPELHNALVDTKIW
jgi:hypothetical protein